MPPIFYGGALGSFRFISLRLFLYYGLVTYYNTAILNTCLPRALLFNTTSIVELPKGGRAGVQVFFCTFPGGPEYQMGSIDKPGCFLDVYRF